MAVSDCIKYISRVDIENFQAIANASIKLHPGMNVIVGRNGMGKSALVRALRWVIRDAFRGTWFITHGQTTCRVGVRVGDIFTIRHVERVLGSDGASRLKMNRYTVLSKGDVDSPLEFDKFKDVPSEVVAALGVSAPLELGASTDDHIDLSIADQHKDAIFILNRPGSLAARLISHSIGITPVLKAMRNMATTHRQTGQSLRDAQETVSSLQEVVMSFPVDRLQTIFDQLDARVSAIRELGRAYKELEKLRQDLLDVVQDGREALSQTKRDRVIAKLPWKGAIDAYESYKNLRELADDLSQVDADIVYFTGVTHVLTFCMDKNLQLLSVLNNVRLIYELLDIDILLSTVQDEVRNSDSMIKEIDKQYHRILVECGQCPTCGQEIKK